MENEIYQILKKHKLPLKKREEVLTDLLLLFSVSGNFSNDKEHLCWANADFNNKCFICGKENCR
jgi:hypothetical protein